MGTLLAAGIGGYSIGQIVIGIIVFIAIIAILIAFVKYSGIAIPPIVVTVFWILLGAFVCIFAVKILMSM